MIRLFVVDAQQWAGNIVATVLQGEPDIQVVGCTEDVATALAQAAACDVFLISAELPDARALALTRALRCQRPKVVVMGLVESEPLLLSYVEAGAAAYVMRDSSGGELIRTIRAAHSGEAFVSPAMAATLVERMRELTAVSKRLDLEDSAPSDESRCRLTEREQGVLALMAQGLTNQEIAADLVIELGTVKNHVHSILKKLKVSNRAQAARCYLSANPPPLADHIDVEDSTGVPA